MERVPVMSFCEPAGTSGKYPALNAETRFDLVTGGARGLGLTLARGLLEHGLAKVALLDIDKAEGEAAVAGLVESFPDRKDFIIFRILDVTDVDQIATVTAEVSQIFGGIDILTTFAGIVNSTRMIDYTSENFRKILDVNATGTFLTAQAVVKDMIAHGRGGSIILIASMAGHIVNYPQTHVAYGTCKAAVLHMTRCMAAELAVHGIRVNSISPGYMETRLNSSSDLQDVLPIWWERTPMGRIGGKEELIGPIVLLASAAGSFMTGSDLVVDGGYTLT